MSYYRRRQQLSGFGGLGALELTSAGFPADANAVPISPGFATDSSGQRWTRTDIFAIPTKVAASTSTISNVGTGIAAILNALAPKPAVVAPSAPIMPVQQGMGMGTKLALAGAGALVLVLIATR